MNDVDTVVLEGDSDHFASVAILRLNLTTQEADTDSLSVRLEQAIYSRFEKSLRLDAFINDVPIFITTLILGATTQGVSHWNIPDPGRLQLLAKWFGRKFGIELRGGVRPYVNQESNTLSFYGGE